MKRKKRGRIVGEGDLIRGIEVSKSSRRRVINEGK